MKLSSVDLGISDMALRKDAQVLIETKSKLRDYRSVSDLANGRWTYACQTVYEVKGGVTICRIDLASKQISKLISPVSSTKQQGSFKCSLFTDQRISGPKQ